MLYKSQLDQIVFLDHGPITNRPTSFTGSCDSDFVCNKETPGVNRANVFDNFDKKENVRSYRM